MIGGAEPHDWVVLKASNTQPVTLELARRWQTSGMLTKKFFGVTRFSLFLPGSAAWKATREGSRQDPDTLHAYLYADERINPRLRIFRDYALPIYAGYAAKHNYTHIVLYSDEMPEKWKAELRAITVLYPFVVLNSEKEHAMSARPIMERKMQEAGAESSAVAWFRVDDDDLLSADYLDQLDRHTTGANRGKGVSFGLGYLGLYADGKFSDYRELHKTMLAQGQAFIGAYDAETRKLSFPKAGNHRISDRITPFIIDSRSPAFLWTQHAGQDTRAAGGDTATVFLEKYKAASASEVGKLFPTLI
ncbi:glycosyltransferase [Arthrobacter oryzae]|uniref:Rhamnosyltransferase n=1 Tax=Arthrobacter oryzae TaxID=409290 RepID=A0A3N0BL83_9MICC|nr:glycosyltransferase [Arthrobacter oryzae]RNL49465.1 hypothetical protein D7003_18605 [Arthrobacter oryzae]